MRKSELTHVAAAVADPISDQELRALIGRVASISTNSMPRTKSSGQTRPRPTRPEFRFLYGM